MLGSLPLYSLSVLILSTFYCTLRILSSILRTTHRRCNNPQTSIYAAKT